MHQNTELLPNCISLNSKVQKLIKLKFKIKCKMQIHETKSDEIKQSSCFILNQNQKHKNH